jgi:uncharacterized protein (TIGR03790 family)
MKNTLPTLGRLAGTTLLVLVCFGAAAVEAQTAANVAVVINEESPASIQVGEHYVRARAIPESNIIRLHAPTEESISRVSYEGSIQRPIALALTERGLQDKILYIVLTKGLPLRIAGTPGPNGTASSVDSELALLYRRMTGREAPVRGRVDNPYFLGAADLAAAKPFNRRDLDVYLVTRLDAFTVADAIALIDRSQRASAEGRILLDQRGDASASIGDLWLVEARERLTKLGHGDRVDLVETASSSADDPVLGYYSWGSNDPANRRRRLGLRFGPGSVAATLAGTDARTFVPPPEGWEPVAPEGDRSKWFAEAPQSLIGDMIRDGATGVGGNVSEPLLASSIRPQVLFPAYLSGFNLAESFYLALPHLSWQGIVIGDPLCRPFAGQATTAPIVEESTDEPTGLPALFAARRKEIVRARIPAASVAVVASVVRAEALVALGKKDEARAAFEEITKGTPALVNEHLQLAQLYEDARDFALAAERYRRVLELQPRNIVALNNLAYRLTTDNKPADALPLARRAAALAPQEARVLDTLAWTHHMLGNDAEAARILADAIRRNAQDAELRFHAAVIAEALGSYTAARSHLENAVRLDPGFQDRADVRELRAKLQKKG